MLVLDASAALNWSLGDEQSAQRTGTLKQLISRNDRIIAPPHWPYEVANGITKAYRRGRISGAQAKDAFDIITDLQVALQLDTTNHVIKAVAALAESTMLSVYDAAYLELAMRLKCELHTIDSGLRSAATKSGVVLLDL